MLSGRTEGPPFLTTMVELRSVSKSFGNAVAVDQVDLSIASGEFITLLGPSGCGKTTILRMISGFETPDTGVVLLDGRDVTHVPPYRRDVNQVFQSYALFPHLNVQQNVEFGLRMKGVAGRERKERAAEAINLVALSGLDQRKPSQLSGGQKQRVALARAIVNRPKVLLLDEPLAALDAKLRRAMQIELKHLQRRLGITFLFVTHDQEEALTMSDRVAVMNAGRIEQLGTALDVYHRPASAFVAGFIGQTNLLEATVIARGEGAARVRVADGIELDVVFDDASAALNGSTVLLSLRPEKLHVSGPGASPGPNRFTARVAEKIFRGETTQLTLLCAAGRELCAVVTEKASASSDQQKLVEGSEVVCEAHADDIVVIRTATERSPTPT